jgi:hypothetical protein
MTGREALEDIRRTNAEVDALLAYRNSLLDRLLSGYNMNRPHVQEQTESKTERSAIRWMEITEDIDKKTDELIDKRNELVRIIEQLGDRRYRDILMRRYAECQPWAKVCEVTTYSPRQAFRLHREALEAFDGIYASKDGTQWHIEKEYNVNGKVL